MNNKAISYAVDFTSFLLERGVKPNKIILFGSLVRGEYDRESDIDIFIDIDSSKESEIRDILNLFEKTRGEKWSLKGVENPLSLIIGNLNSEKWKDLKRDIQSNGILLYGTYNEFPENMQSYIMFRLDFTRLSRDKKVNLWRKLYGYTQKFGNKIYETKGLITQLDGKKIEKSVIIVPSGKSRELKDFLRTNKIGYTVNEIWSDNL